MSSVLKYMQNDWDKSNKRLFLVDTFLSYTQTETVVGGSHARNTAYADSLARTKSNFKEFNNVVFVEGRVPEILSTISSLESISFMHIDLNAAMPEVNGLRILWRRISDGGLVLLDDYGYTNRSDQQEAMDTLGLELGFEVLTLATGQGLIVKH